MDSRLDEMETQSKALYLIALALLQNNGTTYVNREITDALEAIQKELRI